MMPVADSPGPLAGFRAFGDASGCAVCKSPSSPSRRGAEFCRDSTRPPGNQFPPTGKFVKEQQDPLPLDPKPQNVCSAGRSPNTLPFHSTARKSSNSPIDAA